MALVHKHMDIVKSSIDPLKLFKDPNNIYILYPWNGKDIDAILECTCDVNNNDRPKIEDYGVAHDVIVFIGKGKEFRKLHPEDDIECTIYWTPDHKKKVVTDIMDDRIIRDVHDFERSPAYFKKLHNGKIKL